MRWSEVPATERSQERDAGVSAVEGGGGGSRALEGDIFQSHLLVAGQGEQGSCSGCAGLQEGQRTQGDDGGGG